MALDADAGMDDALYRLTPDAFVDFACDHVGSVGFRVRLKQRWEELSGGYLSAEQWCRLTNRPPPAE